MFLDKKTEIRVVKMEMNNQNKAVKSLALKLFSTILPNSSITGQPHPNQSTMNCWFAQLYGISKTANNKSGAARTTIFFINCIQSLFFVKLLFIILFIASFAFVLQMHRAKPIPLRLHISKGSLREGAVSEADWGRARYNKIYPNLKSRRLLPSRLSRATSLSEGGFSLAPL